VTVGKRGTLRMRNLPNSEAPARNNITAQVERPTQDGGNLRLSLGALR
jgi:hypothetical protein